MHEKENKFNQGWRDGIKNKHSGSEEPEYQNGFDHGRQFEKRRYWEDHGVGYEHVVLK